MAKRNIKREHDTNVRKLANTYARTFNSFAERLGIDLPMPLIARLVDLFHDSMLTGEALQRDYGEATPRDAVDPHAADPGTRSPREKGI